MEVAGRADGLAHDGLDDSIASSVRLRRMRLRSRARRDALADATVHGIACTSPCG